MPAAVSKGMLTCDGKACCVTHMYVYIHTFHVVQAWAWRAVEGMLVLPARPAVPWLDLPHVPPVSVCLQCMMIYTCLSPGWGFALLPWQPSQCPFAGKLYVSHTSLVHQAHQY